MQNTITTNTVDLNDPALTESTLITATNNLVAANTAANAAVKARTVYDGAVALINGGTNVDLTSIVSNASFEEGNLNGWTSVNGGAPANNNNWSKDGTWYVERWTANGDNQNHLSNGTLIHDALVLPAGLYTITAKAQNQEQKNDVAGTGYFLYANDEKVEITGTNDYSTSVLLSTDKSELVIKFALENCTGNWISCDNIRLTYVGEDFPAYTLVTGKMNADVAAAQSAAEEAFLANKNITNYNALTTAIVAAQASKDAYAVAATAIANANALKEAHNLASTTAFNTFAEAIAAIETPYTNNTLSNNDANAAGTTLGTVVTGWHSGANGAAVKYMNDGFSLNDFDAALYINTWSNEGESDGSNFKVPFYEYFAGEGNALGENTWTGQVTDLDNGLYSVSAWVRVRSKNAETSAKDVYGISMDVNNGTAVDVTEGDTIAVNEGYGRFQHKVYTAEGLVKNGILKVNFNIAADNNIHWLSFKNIKYTKVRDLTPEEAAVLPTAIALKNGEDVVTEVELTAALNTITLTPSYTPANASEGYISWQSSNEAIATVAGGVVTGVAPGTTTITATSTLDTEISGSVTVTVTYPESEVPATYFVNDGATRTVYTLGENLFKNGSFEYPNAVYGWKTIDYTTDAVASNFTFNATGGVNDGVYITTAGGGVGSEKTLRKSIAIEKGKKYYFSVYTSGKAPSSDNFQYNALFKMSNATTESGTIKQFEWPQGAGNTTTEWSKTECIFTAETDYVGVRMGWNSSTSFDDFVLVEITDETVVGNVDYATAAIPTSNIGTAAFQYSQDAIDAANALVQGTATVEDVENAYTAVTTLNAPEVGKLYNVVNITDGFAHKGKALTFKSASNADLSKNTTSMAWEAVPGSYLPQGVKFTAVDGTKNGYKLSYTRADGNEVYVSTGSLSGLGTNDDQIRPTTDASKALTFVVTSVGDNHWYLYNTAAGKNVGSNGDTGFYTAGGSNKDMKIQEAVENEVALNIDAANQYGTLILPFNADIPAGVTAYSVAETVGNKLTLDEEDAFVANTPYLVFAETGANETLSGLGSAYIDATYTEGLFTGVYAATAAPVGSYVLQKKNESLGFYKVAEGKQPTVGANRAYLTVPAAEARDAFFFGDGETTAIQALKALSEGNAEIYDVNGVRQNTLVKGMNILKMSDGSIRKVMVK